MILPIFVFIHTWAILNNLNDILFISLQKRRKMIFKKCNNIKEELDV